MTVTGGRPARRRAPVTAVSLSGACLSLGVLDAEVRVRQRLQPSLLDGLAAPGADPIGAVVHPGQRPVDLAEQVSPVVLDRQVPFPLEGERPRIGVLIVEGNLARYVRLRGGKGRLLDG